MTQEITSTLATIDHPAIPADGLLPASPQRQATVIGINQDGRFYLYGPSATERGPEIEAVMGVILGVGISTHGTPESRYGERDYLDVRIQSPTPSLQYLLRLPAHQGQWSYRSLLGALQCVELSATALKIEPVRGREATFIQVSLDPEGFDRVIAPAIGPERSDLEDAIDACRRLLGLEPQFPLSTP